MRCNLKRFIAAALRGPLRHIVRAQLERRRVVPPSPVWAAQQRSLHEPVFALSIQITSLLCVVSVQVPVARATYMASVLLASCVGRDSRDNVAFLGISGDNVVGRRARPVMDEASNAAALAIESLQLTSMRRMT